MTDPLLKAAAVSLLESGELRVAEVADLIGESRQLVATWCPNATLEARRKWCRKRWNAAITASTRPWCAVHDNPPARRS